MDIFKVKKKISLNHPSKWFHYELIVIMKSCRFTDPIQILFYLKNGSFKKTLMFNFSFIFADFKQHQSENNPRTRWYTGTSYV